MQRSFQNEGFETGAATFPPAFWNNFVSVNTVGTIDTTVVHDGARSCKLVNSAAGEDSYLEWAYSPYLATLPGVTYTVNAWVNCTVFTAGALSNRGLVIRTDGAVTSADITATTGGWIQLTASRTATTYFALTLRLYAPQGTVYWDDVSVFDNTGFYVPDRMPMVGA